MQSQTAVNYSEPNEQMLEDKLNPNRSLASNSLMNRLGFYLMRLRSIGNASLPGELVEYGDTATMFSTPVDERTKAYLTGKMG